MKAEQRQHLRRSVQVEFRAVDQLGVGELFFDSRDVSPGGAFLQADLLFEEGEALSLEFVLPDGRPPIKAKGLVAWVRRFPAERSEPGMGIRFTELAQEDEKALEEFTSR
jgi:uncharacterized protein (TIGR02266 family)